MTSELKFPDYYQQLKSDFTVLQVSERQFRGIQKVAELANSLLKIDIHVILNIVYRILIEEQKRTQRYHDQSERDSLEVRLSSKVTLSNFVIEELGKALEGTGKEPLIKPAVMKGFSWYKEIFLTNKDF